MIAQEVVDYKAHQSALNQSSGLPKPKEALVGPSRDQVEHIAKEDDEAGGAMDIDEELRMRDERI